MKIGLLNLPVDNNYGGNLQRFALIKVLEANGFKIEHINLRFKRHYPWYKISYLGLKFSINCIKQGCRDIYYLSRFLSANFIINWVETDLFYHSFIPHTRVVTSKHELVNFLDYDALIVGSDQVWRKTIAKSFGISTFFFDYLPKDKNIKLLAYAVSLGTDENELEEVEIQSLKNNYARFTAVSVREISALNLLKQYHWDAPKPIQVLDPTFLLKKEDYERLIFDSYTRKSSGNLFCYILDATKEKQDIIDEVAAKHGLTPFYINLRRNPATIQQWLRSFYDAEYVVTDSFHGMVFSIIFNKPFRLIRNQFRGTARFDSVLNLLQVDEEMPDWDLINNMIEVHRNQSIGFLISNLKQ